MISTPDGDKSRSRPRPELCNICWCFWTDTTWAGVGDKYFQRHNGFIIKISDRTTTAAKPYGHGSCVGIIPLHSPAFCRCRSQIRMQDEATRNATSESFHRANQPTKTNQPPKMKFPAPFYSAPSPISPDAAGYLPLNLRSGRDDPGHRLARIDPVFRDGLLQFNWRTTTSGLVHRVFRDVVNSKRARKTLNHVEHLALRLLDLPPGSDWHTANNDILDLRLGNLRRGRTQGPPVDVAPGSTFYNESSFAAAIHDLTCRRSTYVKLLRFGPTPKLTETQVRKLLTTVRDDKLLRGASLRTIGEWMHDTFGFGFYPSYLHRVLRGEALRVRDFDYKSLTATRKTRAQIAREHWQQRREEAGQEIAA